MLSLLESGNVDFVEGLFGIEAWTNEDNNILFSNLKDLKGIISYSHHNFPIYPNYHYINVILNFPLFQNFDLIVIFSGRVGGAPVRRKMERKKKKQDGGWKRGMGADCVKS